MRVKGQIKTEHHGNPKGRGRAVVTLVCSVKGSDYVKECEVETENTTKNELSLMAVIAGLRELTKPCDVIHEIDGGYIPYQSRNLKKWEGNGWQRAAGRGLKNAKLWQQLKMLLKIHKVEFRRLEQEDE